MRSSPTVSVIIPAYGHSKYILQTLDSVFAQSFQDYEVIVVNDGSPDDTADVLKPLIDAGRIHYFVQENSGVAIARNSGISQAKGKYIALLDDDDLWPPDKLEWQVDYLERSSAVVIGGTVEIFGSGKNSVWKGHFDEAKGFEHEDFFDGNPFHSPGQLLIRHDVLIAAGGFDENIWGADDMDMLMSLSRIGKVLKIDRISLKYRLHETNASKNFDQMMFNSKLVIEKHLKFSCAKQVSDCRRRGYLWLFNYFGYTLLLEGLGKSDIQKNSFLSRISKIIGFTQVFGWELLCHRNLLMCSLLCMKKACGTWRNAI